MEASENEEDRTLKGLGLGPGPVSTIVATVSSSFNGKLINHQRSNSLNSPQVLHSSKSVSPNPLRPSILFSKPSSPSISPVHSPSLSPPPPPDAPDFSLSPFEGYLHFSSPEGNWQRIWVTLKNNLFAFGPQKDELDGAINLSIIQEAEEGPTISKANQYIFVLTTVYRVIYLSASSGEERASWLKAIKEQRDPGLTWRESKGAGELEDYKEGVLYRHTGHTGPRRWQKLWAVHQGGLLFLSTGKGDPPKTHLVLSDILSVSLGDPKEKKKTFVVTLPKQSRLFYCKTLEEREQWMKILSGKKDSSPDLDQSNALANKRREEEEGRMLKEVVCSDVGLMEKEKDKGFLTCGQSAVISECSFELSVLEFFVLFFSDSSLPFSQHYRAKRGDYEVEIGKWEANSEFGMTRNSSFRSPIKGGFVGPKSTKVLEVSRYQFSRQKLVIEIRGQMPDLPISIKVETRWEVVETGPYSCRSVQSMATETKSVLLRGKVQSATVAEGKESFSVWEECALSEVRSYREKIYGAATLAAMESQKENLQNPSNNLSSTPPPSTSSSFSSFSSSFSSLTSNPFFFSTIFLAVLLAILVVF